MRVHRDVEHERVGAGRAVTEPDEDLPARYLRQWIHENIFPTCTDKPFPECLKALGLRDPRLTEDD